ncbi:MAG TPA: T9SS type A sorting domain-containing protein, partial [Bacteroidia bacterium]|nr:T9SS type A sorting domain-containing protein [Bacteroidia bacterium]
FHILQGYSGSINLVGSPIATITNSGFIQQDGSFYGASAFIEVLSRFTQTGGTFISTDDQLRIGGQYNWNDTIFKQTGGMFFANYGVVAFCPDGVCSALQFVVAVNAGTNFSKVLIEAQSTCSPGTPSSLVVANGQTLNTISELHHADGLVEGQWSCEGELYVHNGADGGNGSISMRGSLYQRYYRFGSNGSTCGLVISKPAGQVEPAVGTSDFAVNSFTLINGSFKMPSDTFLIEGMHSAADTVFAHFNGTLDHNEGWTVFACYDPTSSPVSARVYGHSVSLYNVAFVGAPSAGLFTMEIAATDSFRVENLLVLANGALTGSPVICEGDVTVLAGFQDFSSTLVFFGKDPQVVNASGNPSAFNGNIVLNKELDQVTLLSSLVLDQPSQNLQFAEGNLRTSSSAVLEIHDFVLLTGMHDSSHVVGPVTKNGSQAFTFPTGNGFVYAPIAISGTTDANSSYTCEYILSFIAPSSSGQPVNAPLAVVSDCEQWNLVQNSGTDSVYVTLSWESARSCAVATLLDIDVAYNATNTWNSLGASSPVGTSAAGNVTTATAFQPNGTLTLGSVLTTSIANPEIAGNAMSVYPNPFTTSFVVNATEEVNLIIIDAAGRVVLEQSCREGQNTINTGQLAAGVYTVRLLGSSYDQSSRMVKL